MVPVHELLTTEEEEKVLAKFGKKELFPKIKRHDPALAIFDIKAKTGDMVKITRNELTGVHVFYRVVR